MLSVIYRAGVVSTVTGRHVKKNKTDNRSVIEFHLKRKINIFHDISGSGTWDGKKMVTLKIPPEEAVLLINERIDEIKMMREDQNGPGYYDFIGWLSKTWAVIDRIYGGDEIHPEEIRIIGLPTCSCNSARETQMLVEVYHSRLLDYINEIRIFMQKQE